jgi:hypothetical protein
VTRRDYEGRHRPTNSECAAVQTEIRGTTTSGKNDVIVTSDFRPAHFLSDWNRDDLRIEEIVLDAHRNRSRTRRPANYVDGPVHRRPVNLAVVLQDPRGRKGEVEDAAIRQSLALELHSRYSRQFVDKQRNLVIRTWRVRIAHDESTE